MKLSAGNVIKLKDGVAYLTLILLTLYTYHPFFSLQFLGAADALWYQRIITDAVIQLRHHLFPAYIGQSNFNYFGVPLIRAPLMIFFVQGLDLLSLHQLPILAILHAIVIFSTIFASVITYYLLRKIIINSRIGALTLSFLYISTPGVITLIYQFDMYFSITALPFIPMVIYSLMTFPRNNWWGIFGLALTWMAHPPLAMVITSIALMYLLLHVLMHRKDTVHIIQFFLWVFVLTTWQIISLLILQADSLSLPAQLVSVKVTQTIRILLDDIPWVFFPFAHARFPQPITVTLQLGYSLWTCFFLALWFCIKNKKLISTKLWLVTIFLIVMLYPLSVFKYLWYLVPSHVLSLFVCPMQRIYMVLSGLVCFIAASVLARTTINKVFIYLAAIVCIAWNIHETNFMHNMLTQRTTAFHQSPSDVGKYFYWYGIEPIHMKFSRGYYEPALKNKLYNSQMMPIPSYNLEEILKTNCLEHPATIIKQFSFNPPMPYSRIIYQHQPWVRIHLPQDRRQVLCIHTQSSKAQAYFMANDDEQLFMEMMDISHSGPTGLMFLFNHTAHRPEMVIHMESWGEKMKVDAIGNSTYDLNDLPIKTVSSFPLQLELNNPEDNTYLEIFKSYYPGYVAYVNGAHTKVLSSPNQLVLIPLPSKGTAKVELFYKGTVLMEAMFYLTLLMWLIALWRACKSIER